MLEAIFSRRSVNLREHEFMRARLVASSTGAAVSPAVQKRATWLSQQQNIAAFLFGPPGPPVNDTNLLLRGSSFCRIASPCVPWRGS